MTDYTTIPDAVFTSDKPARAVDMRALRDNIAAMAEGASGAPPITPLAFLGVTDSLLGRFSISASATAITGLDGVDRIRIDTENAPGSTTIQLGVSANGGTSWVGYQSVMGTSGPAFITVRLSSGLWVSGASNITSSGSFSGSPFNAIRLRISGGAESKVAFVWADTRKTI